MQQSDTFHKTSTTTTNLLFLTEHTGEMYLYVFNFFDGARHIEAFVHLQNEDIQNFLLQNKMTVPKISRVSIEDLSDIKIIRQLENMERLDEIIKEKILVPLMQDVFSEKIADTEKSSHSENISTDSFLSLRNPYDIQHITGQMAVREGKILECKRNAGGCTVGCMVWY